MGRVCWPGTIMGNLAGGTTELRVGAPAVDRLSAPLAGTLGELLVTSLEICIFSRWLHCASAFTARLHSRAPKIGRPETDEPFTANGTPGGGENKQIRL